MKSLLIIITVLIHTSVYSQEFNKVVFDERVGKNIIKGWCDVNGLKETVWSDIFKLKYNAYTLDYTQFVSLQAALNSSEILIVLATWCGDSEDWVPPFIKILDEISFNKKNLRLIALDRNFDSGIIGIRPFDTQKVPTFIFYRDGVEVGRIIEKPKETLEVDILKIYGLK